MTDHPYRTALDDAGFALGAFEVRGRVFPLQRVDLHIRLRGVHAHVSIEQELRNDRDEPLEVTYVFPAPALGAVSSYTFAIDARSVRGVLYEREDARTRYDAAIAAGHAASTLEEDRPEVLTLRIGNLAPGATARVRIGLDLMLPLADDCAVLRLPLVVAARYVPGRPIAMPAAGAGTSPDTDAAPDASRVTPPLAAADPGVRVGVIVDAYGFDDVTATHPVIADRRLGALRVTLDGIVPDRDIVLRFPLRMADEALVVRDPDGAAATLVVTSCALSADEPPPLDVAIAIDRSGSMSGAKMVAARRAAAGIVDSLGPEDRMTVLAFDHLLDAPLGASLIAASAGRRRAATDFLSALDARGGTEMATALAAAVAAFDRVDPGRRRAIVLVTDGQVANEDQLVRLIRPLRGVEILAVAIGPAANQGLCQRLAAATGAAVEAAETDAVLGGALDRTLRRLLAPTLDDLGLEIDGANLVPGSLAPARPPRLVPGIPTVLAARVRGTPTAVRVVARDRERRAVVRSVPLEVIDAPALRRVWARLRIRDLEDAAACAAFPAGPRLEDELIETSLSSGVMSRYTAFVAVDEARAVAPGTPLARVSQPVLAAADRGGAERATRTQSGTLRGKLAYLSPEQARGYPTSPATDVFALAHILAELATLTRLFRADTDFETLKAIVDGPPIALPRSLGPLGDVLAAALARDPAARPGDGAALLSLLSPLAHDRTGLSDLARLHARAIPDPVIARSRSLWITERLSSSWEADIYAAAYAGPAIDALHGAIVRVPNDSDPDATPGDPVAIASPHVARLLGLSTAPRRAHVIERVPGVDLGALTRAKPQLAPAQLAAIAIDCASALAAIHALGIVHRKLEPRSFVLSTAGRAVLVDLPIAKQGTALPRLAIPLRGFHAADP